MWLRDAPWARWLRQALVMLIVISPVFALIQFLKGHSLEYSLEFGAFWGVISTVIFSLTRAYNYKRNIYCALCNDLPAAKEQRAEHRD